MIILRFIETSEYPDLFEGKPGGIPLLSRMFSTNNDLTSLLQELWSPGDTLTYSRSVLTVSSLLLELYPNLRVAYSKFNIWNSVYCNPCILFVHDACEIFLYVIKRIHFLELQFLSFPYSFAYRIMQFKPRILLFLREIDSD